MTKQFGGPRLPHELHTLANLLLKTTIEPVDLSSATIVNYASHRLSRSFVLIAHLNAHPVRLFEITTAVVEPLEPGCQPSRIKARADTDGVTLQDVLTFVSNPAHNEMTNDIRAKHNELLKAHKCTITENSREPFDCDL